jgi:hypothetical protein
MRQLMFLAAVVISTSALAQGYPAEVQPLIDKMRSGQQLTPEEQARLRDAMMSQASQRATSAAQRSGATPETQAILQKAQSGQQLTPEEQQQLKSWATQRGAAAQQGAAAAPSVPPDIMDLARKKHSGQELTPEETQRMMQYSQQRGQKSAPTEGVAKAMGYALEAGGAVPKARPDLDLSKRKRLTLTEYLALLQQVVTETRAQLGTDWGKQLDDAMAQNAKLGRSLGVLLTFSPVGPTPSAYMLASSALLSPKDAQQASNVGVALYNANFFERSYDVLAYADGLKPNSPTILSNQGYAAMYLGDLKMARSLFEAAVKAGGKMPDARVGLALIGKATGDQAMMMAAAGQAIAEGSGSFVDQVMESSSTATESEDQRAQDTPLADQGGSGSMGGVVYDMTGGSQFDWPVWTIPASPDTAVSYQKEYATWVQKEAVFVRKLGDQMTSVNEAYVQAHQAKEAQAGATGLYFPRRNPRILIILGDLSSIYDARLNKELKAWEKSYQSLIQKAPQVQMDLVKQETRAWEGCPNPDPDNYCAKKVEYEYCEKRHAQAREFHGAAGESYGQHVARARDLMNEFWKKSDPYFQGIADPAVSESRDLQRELLAHKYLLAMRADVPGWLAAIAPLTAGKCVMPPPPDPAVIAAIHKDPKTPKAKPGNCIPSPGSFGLGPVSTKWDCGGFTIQGGEGLFGGVSVKFAGANHKGTMSGHTETTVFAGFGDELAVGRANGEAKAVISFTQAQGQVVDVGAEYSTSASAAGFGSKADIGMDLTWGMRSGPNMSASAEASWAGQTLGSAKL